MGIGLEDAYQIKMMPSAKQVYCSLRQTTRRFQTDPQSLSSPSWKSTTEHFERVNEILCSLMNPDDVILDQSLLERMNWLLTRSIDSTLVYFLRIEQYRRVSVLHITEFNNTDSYARFCAFLDAGGCRMLADLGVDIPTSYIGPPGLIN